MLKFDGRAASDYLKFRSAHVFVAPRSRAETRQQHHPEEEVHHDATVGSSLVPSVGLHPLCELRELLKGIIIERWIPFHLPFIQHHHPSQNHGNLLRLVEVHDSPSVRGASNAFAFGDISIREQS